MSSSGIKNVFGAAGFNPDRTFGELKDYSEVFQILDKGGVKILDTAALYGESERILGEIGAPKRFTIDTKAKGGFSKADRENVLAEAKSSKEKLGTTVDIFYLHAPDPNTPLEETLAAINEVHQSGFFKRFGVSNFKVEDVQKVYDHCKEHGYPLPSVYQGNYSAVARLQESLLLPTLRKLGIAFYAYSPIAGGFLTKTKQDIIDKKGRFDDSFLGQMYSNMYSKPSYLEALAQWESIAKDEGVSRADLAYRWVKYNSALKPEYGDAIIIGASSVEQLKQTLDSINTGPISDNAAKRIDAVWDTIKHEAPLDNYHR